MTDSKRVFITGGAGFLGINFVRYLLARGFSPVSFDIADFDYPERGAITAVTGDIRNYEALENAMRGCGVVVHAAAALPSYTPRDIMSTEVAGTRNVLQAAVHNGIPRVVHISSTAVYGTKASGATEESPVEVIGPYAEAKILAENECAAFRAKGLCVPVLRPKTFVGPERLGIWSILYDWAHSGSGFPLIGEGRNRYQLLDVEDLCDAIHACMTGDAETVNGVFNVGAKAFASMREDFQAVLDHAGHGKKIRGIPAGPIILALKVLEKLKLSPVYEWVYETAAVDSYVSIEKAERLLGFHPKYSNREALVKNYDWYVAHLDQFGQTSGISHRTPWKQGLIGLGKKFF
ncbi:MAG TPA: NAD-dependent epimerase/dehydratase family protein [Vicinamibacterales bacterium]|nr:NAD-dependent epimerase/dehydratase family protein [Vicinamibacterales bacterium]